MLRIVTQKTIRYYTRANDHSPFLEWLGQLESPAIRQRIKVHVDRMKAGHIADWKTVGGGVFELRLHFGPGYRVYFALDGTEIVLLLCAGDKSSQTKDILKARGYWEDYKERQYGEKK